MELIWCKPKQRKPLIRNQKLYPYLCGRNPFNYATLRTSSLLYALDLQSIDLLPSELNQIRKGYLFMFILF